MQRTGFIKTAFLVLAVWLTAVILPFPQALVADTAQTYEITAPILAAADDIEELLSDGSLHFNSTHLNLGCAFPDSADDTKAQLVFLRFDSLQVPPGAQIIQAYIQFTSYSANSSEDLFDFAIAVEDTADSAPLPVAADEETNYAASSRAVNGSIRWASDVDNRLLWHSENTADESQRTPDLSILVQQTINQSGWQYGNAIAFMLQGTGNRIAVSYENNPAKAAVLHITYTAPPLAQPAPQTLTVWGTTNPNDNDGAIQGTTQAMEYKPVGGNRWKPCGDGAVIDLPAGEYLVRYTQKPGYAQGDSLLVSVAQYVLDITLQPGADETQMNFTWYSKYSADQQSLVQIAPQAAMDGDAFPAASAQTYTGENSFSSDYLSNTVTVSGLEPDTGYVYRLGNGTSYSKPFPFSTQNPEDYHFIFVGDPQIGGSGGDVRDTNAWRETLHSAIGTFPNAAFILSAGDQINLNGSEDQYSGFFSPTELASVPFVPTIGNHEVWGTHAGHFNPPNESDTYGTSVAGADYWFTYGSTLFMVLNTNSFHIADHKAFLADAIASAGNSIRWKIVVFHHSIYSSGSHSMEDTILEWRKYLVPLFDFHRIDVVLMGHDHCYTRTFQMLGNVAQSSEETTVVNPSGTLYITANSATGSKYYDLQNLDEDYSAFHWQGYERTYTNIAITSQSFSLGTYLAADNTVIDQYTIYKDDLLITPSP